MPQWKEVSPDFKGSTHAFGDAMQQINTVAGIPTQLLKTIEEQKRYDAQQQQHNLERGQDVAFREAQAKQAADQFNKDYLLRQATADRDAEKFGREKLGDTRLQGMQSDISAGLQHGLLSQEQQKNIENRVGKFSDADIASGRAADIMTKEFGNVLKAPQTAKDKLNLIRNYQTTGDGYDASKLLAYQQQLAKPYEDQIAKEEDQAFRLKLSDRDNAAAAARLAKQLAAEKEKPVTLYKTDAQGNIVYTQARSNAELQALTTKGGWNLGGNIDRAPVSKSTMPALFGSSKEATNLNLDLFGSGDTDKARLLGQRLQNAYKLKPDEVGNILSQSTGGFIDKSIDPDKLATALLNAGAASTMSGARNAAKTLLASPNN